MSYTIDPEWEKLLLTDDGSLERSPSSRLKQPRSFRRTFPKACATCAHVVFGDFMWVCQRPHGPAGDVGDGYQWHSICDYWSE